jgi:hypothetical protein
MAYLAFEACLACGRQFSITNGLNRTLILIALVLVLLLNTFLYCPRAAHSFSKETRSVKALLLGQSKTSYYKVLLYEHSIYSYNGSSQLCLCCIALRILAGLRRKLHFGFFCSNKLQFHSVSTNIYTGCSICS